ncbi:MULTISPECIES: prephenate dehydrogenase [Thauera]|jgi:prephenate dehydrogenase|uniref:prephenate dehydrogenase n=1 Tax=Thauera TaxID=33057 RepID=UPI0023F1C956|nr:MULTISPECIES: prephenate dehydrogenase/arogenate dehydrogenase family protein [Thauera]MDD3675358.1 prephenate dehydrogenase/arogenate dehydrogenase family protein [Thauera propionica]
MPLIGKLVICGVGLIGGSFALGLKRADAVGQIVGIGRRREPLERALALGVIDEIATDWADALRDADLVLLAAPVGQMDAIMAAMAPHLQDGTVVTDAGSTKRDVVAAIRYHLGHRLAQVVPAHPIAGAEKSGVEAAFADLYVKRKVVLTPLPESRGEAVERVRAAWQACGATVVDMSPQEHDQVFAAVSHLPHLLAFGLVDDLAQRDNAELLFSHAASGFRDFTRIAGSHPEMWRDICVANRVALLAELDAYLDEMARLRAMLAAGDGPALEAVFERARRARNAWAEGLPVQTAE